MNSLRSNSISHFVVQIAFRNPKLNVDSKNLHSSKDLLVRIVFLRAKALEKYGAPCGYELCSLGLSKNVFLRATALEQYSIFMLKYRG